MNAIQNRALARTAGRHARGLGVGVGLVLLATHAAAEPFPTRAERIMSPGRSAASEDGVEALVLNPANVAGAPAPELRYTGMRCPETRRVSCGHALGASAPLLWGLATGLRVDYITPPGGPEGAGFPYNGRDFVWLTWGLGYRLSERLSVGATVQWSHSGNSYTDGLFGISTGISYRPNTHFGFALIAHDFNGPSTQPLPTRGYPVLDRSYVAAMAFRPLGTRSVELGVEGKYFDGTNQVRPRVTLGVDLPGIGRARGDVEVQNIGNDRQRGVLGTAGLEIYFNGLSGGGGALFGSALGANQAVGQYVTASISGALTPGVPRVERGVYIRMEGTPGARSHVHLLRRLWQLAEDKEIAAVTMVMRAEPASSFAHAEELADAFRVLKARGKRVVCSFEDAGPKALYACASANRIVINPAGGIRYSGLHTTHLYLAGLLKKIGVKAEFVRIGAHKGAPEQLMNEHASDVARADQEDLLKQHEAVFVRNLWLYRNIKEDRVREITAKGPFVASEARDAKLVDGYAFDDELERVTQDVVGRKVSYKKLKSETLVPKYFGARKRIALLYIDGNIVDGRSSTIPLIGTKLVGSYTIADTAKQLKDNSDVRAVVIRVESPGGSSMGADVMWRAIKQLAEKKPVIVSMGSMATSGGYYVSAPAKKIFALPLTLTGSIGIFYGKADVSELLKKIGVNVEVRKTTGRADAESFFRGFTDDERKELQRKVGQFYDIFVDRVSQGRKLTKEEVNNVGQGRVWTGQQAMDRKLVDRMGGLRHALEAARAEAGLPEDCPIVEYPPKSTTLLERALKLAGLRAGATIPVDGLPVQVKSLLRAVAPLAVYAEGLPLARAEWVPVEDMEGDDDIATDWDPYP